MNYALIQNGAVANVIWLSASNAQEFPDAVQTGGLPVRTGDTYDGSFFYRNGERLLSSAEAAERLLNELMGGVEDVQYE